MIPGRTDEMAAGVGAGRRGDGYVGRGVNVGMEIHERHAAPCFVPCRGHGDRNLPWNERGRNVNDQNVLSIIKYYSNVMHKAI